jgi:C-terminal domain of Sin3a protein
VKTERLDAEERGRISSQRYRIFKELLIFKIKS